MIMLTQASTAASERGVGALQHAYHLNRASMNPETMEFEIVCSHYFNDTHYVFAEFIKKLDEMLAEEQKK